MIERIDALAAEMREMRLIEGGSSNRALSESLFDTACRAAGILDMLIKGIVAEIAAGGAITPLADHTSMTYYTRMEYEWDSAKATSNLAKHGVDFPAATEALEDPGLLVIVDERYVEPRYRAIGLVNGVVLSVAYTMRGDVCRIISARRASRRERETYHCTL